MALLNLDERKAAATAALNAGLIEVWQYNNAVWGALAIPGYETSAPGVTNVKVANGLETAAPSTPTSYFGSTTLDGFAPVAPAPAKTYIDWKQASDGNIYAWGSDMKPEMITDKSVIASLPVHQNIYVDDGRGNQVVANSNPQLMSQLQAKWGNLIPEQVYTYNGKYIDAAPVYKLSDQIWQQYQNAGLDKYYSGGARNVYGPMGLSEQMAASLAAKGITDLSQVQQKTIQVPEVDDTGAETGRMVDKKVAWNAATNQPLAQTDNRSYFAEGQDNVWSGTEVGAKDTDFRVQFDAQGKPVFYSTGRDTGEGFLGTGFSFQEWIPAILTIAPGIGQAIGSQILSTVGATGASTAVANAVGNAVITAVATGGDIEKAVTTAATGYLGGQAGSAVGSAVAETVGSAGAGQLVNNVVSAATTSVLNGQDPTQAIQSAIVNTGINLAQQQTGQASGTAGTSDTFQQPAATGVQPGFGTLEPIGADEFIPTVTPATPIVPAAPIVPATPEELSQGPQFYQGPQIQRNDFSFPFYPEGYIGPQMLQPETGAGDKFSYPISASQDILDSMYGPPVPITKEPLSAAEQIEKIASEMTAPVPTTEVASSGQTATDAAPARSLDELQRYIIGKLKPSTEGITLFEPGEKEGIQAIVAKLREGGFNDEAILDYLKTEQLQGQQSWRSLLAPHAEQAAATEGESKASTATEPAPETGGGLTLIDADEQKKLYDTGTGFTLVVNNDGSQKLLDNETGGVTTLTPAEAQQNVDQIVAADTKAQTATTQPATTEPAKADTTPAAETTQPVTPPVTPPVVTPPVTTEPAVTKEQLDAAIANIKIPAGISREDVTTIVDAALKANPNITANDVTTIVNTAISKLPTAPTLTDIRKEITDATSALATTADINKAISEIKFPEGISKADVTTAITDYMKANPGLQASDVASEISKYMTANPPLTGEDVTTAINTALSGVATKRDITNAISGIQFPAGISKADVAAEIKTYMDNNPGLSLEDVSRKITDATSGLATPADIQTKLSTALANYATKLDITNAINAIDLPQGISATDVSAIVDKAFQDNPGLSKTDVSTIVETALKGLPAAPTLEQIDTKIGEATANLATKTQLDTAIANIKLPPGLSRSDVAAEIKSYMDENPGLKAADVASEISRYMTENPPLNKTDVTNAINTSISGLATKADIATAINNIDFPVGLSKADVTNAITTYMEQNPGLSLSDVAAKITERTRGLATNTYVDTALASALEDVATTQDIKDAIDEIKFPASLSKADVTASIKEFMDTNPSLTLEDVKGLLTTSLSELPKAPTLEQIDTKMSEALLGVATKKDIDTAIDNIDFPVGISKEDVADEIKTYMENNPGLKATDVTKAISDYMTENPPATKSDITTAISTATSDLVTEAQLNTALDNIDFPVGISKEDVAGEIKTYMENNPGLKATDVTKAISDYMTENPPANKNDITTAISNATSGLVTEAQLNTALDNIDFPVGISKEDVASEIKKYMEENPGLKATDVTQAISDWMDVNPALTTTDVKTIVGEATSDLATKNDITTAIQNIQFPPGISKEDVADEIKTYMEKNPGLQASDVSKAVADWMAANPAITTTDVSKIVGDATANLVTDEKLAEALGNIKFPEGLSKDDVSGILSDYMKANPGLSLDQVVTAVKGELEKLPDYATSEQLNTAIDTATSGLKTEITGVKTSIAGIESNLLKSIADIQSGNTTQFATVNKAIEDLKAAGVTEDQIKTLISENSAGLSTEFKSALNEVAAGNTKGLTDLQTKMESQIGGVQSDIAKTRTDLTEAIDAARAEGLQGTAALQKALDTVAGDLGTTKEELLGKLGSTEQQLKADFSTQLGGVREELVGVESRLSDLVSQAVKSGLQGDEALGVALEKLASDLGTSKQELLGTLQTTESALRSDFSSQLGGVRGEISASEARLGSVIDQLRQSGVQGDAALRSAIDQVAAESGVTRDQLLERIGKTETQLQQDFAAQIGGVQSEIAQTKTQLSEQIEAAKAQGLQGDAALNAAINSVASSLGTTREDLLSRLGTTEQGLRSEFQTGLAGATKTLQDQYNALSETQKAQFDQLVQQGASTNAALQAVQSGLQQQITSGQQQTAEQIAAVQQSLQSQIAANEAAGLTRDQATNKALEDVAASVGTTKESLLAQIGQTQQSLEQQLTQSQAQTQAQISQLDAATQARFEQMTEAQKAQALQLAQSTNDLQGAINAVSQQTQQQITGVQTALESQLSEQGKQFFDALRQQGVDYNTALQQAVNAQSEQFTTAQQQLAGQIGQLSQETQNQYSSLTDAQKAEVAARQKLGEDLTSAISGVSTSLAGQIGELSTATQQQYQNLTQAQKNEVDARIKQGQDLQTAISGVQSGLEQKIETGLGGLETRLNEQGRTILDQLEQQGIDYQTALETAIAQQQEKTEEAIGEVSKDVSELEKTFNSRVDELIADGKNETDAIKQALVEIKGSISGLSSGQQPATTNQPQAASTANQSLLGSLGLGLGALGAATAAAAAPTPDTKMQRFVVGSAPTAKFEGPLEQFLKMSQSGYTQPAAQPEKAEEQGMNYYSYGQPSDINLGGEEQQFAAGGMITPLMAMGGYAPGGLNVVHHSGKARIDFRRGAHVAGPGDGQSDDIPAMLADGEFVFPADVVSALGNGSTKAGSDKLYKMMHEIRARARSSKPKDLPPPALKSPLEYLGRR